MQTYQVVYFIIIQTNFDFMNTLIFEEVKQSTQLAAIYNW